MPGEDNFHSLNIAQTYEKLSSGAGGLSARQAEETLLEYGPNELTEGSRKTFVVIFLSQLKNLMLIVLFAASVVSLILGETADFVIIFMVILLNALMGAVQESKAASALNALKKMSAPFANVIRDGKAMSVKASQLVPGDVVMLAAGDSVPADIRLATSALLKADESALTGESAPVDKDAQAELDQDTPLAERVNMLFSGTSITYGRGEGVVCRTGMDTEIGRIAGALRDAKEGLTPLQKRLGSLSKALSVAVIIIAAAIFAAGVLSGRQASQMFLIAVSLAVAAIPEGLATVVTLQMTMGVQKMSRQGAIVRSLPAVETLGSTDVICSDKTGTLTQNRMSVQKVYYNGREYAADSVAEGSALNLLDTAFLLCNDTRVSSEEGKTRFIGDPTETALFEFAEKRLGADFGVQMERVFEIPFDSQRKLMSTVNGRSDYTLYVKGAPDALIERCSLIFTDGELRELSEEQRKEIHDANDSMAGNALRVIAAAYKPLESKPSSIEGLESSLIFIGLAGMIDPPRPEVKAAVQTCRQAGIMPVMITGDHKTTATAIAKELGILEEGARALDGRELSALSDEQLSESLYDIRVYARVAPKHKVRIVKAFQGRGNVVAMTGDGVNDAPALKTADIGVGMGITGTEVSKNASDMVLTDDNFATIVKAVEEGRRIYRNIKKAVQFLLSTNLSEVLTLFTGTMLGATVLYPAQILWINLVTDTFPALALGMEPAPRNIMKRAPIRTNEGFFSGLVGNLVFFGMLMAAFTLGIYYIALPAYGEAAAVTMAFLTLGLSQLFHAFNIRSSSYSALKGIAAGKWIIGAFVLSAALQVLVVIVTPLGVFFRTVPLNGIQWLYVLAASIAIVPVSELLKLMKRLHIRRVDERN